MGLAQNPSIGDSNLSFKNENLESAPANTTEGLVVAHHGVAVKVQWNAEHIEMVRVSRKSGFLVGDRVYQKDDKLKRLQRTTELKRATTAGHTLSLAANIDLVGIVVAPKPRTKPTFIDQVIIASQAAGISNVLIVNKSDLPDFEPLVSQLQRHYQGSLPIIATCAHEPAGLQSIANAIAQYGRGVFVGVSGVGKSSLVNALKQDQSLEVGALSEASGFGKHTTTTATLHPLHRGGEIVDTPGVREFIPVAIQPQEVAQYFPGFSEALKEDCRFNDCLHRKEPRCAVKAAVASGTIAPARYESYLSLLEQTEKQTQPQWQKPS